MKSQAKSRARGGVIAWALVAAVALVGLTGGETSAEVKNCQGEWDVSPADGYCSNTTILQSEVVDPKTGENQGILCDITTSCSFDVTYGSGGSSSVTLTPSLSLAAFSLGSLYLLTICVTESIDANGNATYSARVYHDCNGTNEYRAKAVEAGQFHD